MTIESVNNNSDFSKYLNKQVSNKINLCSSSENSGKSIFDVFKKATDGIAEFAKSFLGANENDGSADKFLNGASSSETPWCAAFVQYILEHASKLPAWYQNISNKWYCPSIDDAATNSNAKTSAENTKSGDIVLFDWDNDGVKDHVGIVYSNKNGQITTIEGNSSDQVKLNTYNAEDNRLSFCSV